MAQHVTVTHEAESPDGMTLHELHDFTRDMLDRGLAGDQVVRVRTRFGANKHGAVLKTITAVDTGRAQ